MCAMKSARRPIPRYRWWAMAAVLVATLAVGPVVRAQDPWEYTPYRVHVWLALENVPELPEALRRDIERAVVEQSEAGFGATWDLKVASAPNRFASEVLYRLDQLPVEDLVTAAVLGKSAQPKKAASSKPPTEKPATDAKPATEAQPAAAQPAPSPKVDPTPMGSPTPMASAAPMPMPIPMGTGCEQMETSSVEATANQGNDASGGATTESTNQPPAASADASTAPPMAPATPMPGMSGSGGDPTIGSAGAAASGSDVAGAEAEEEKVPALDPLVVHLREIFAGDKLLAASVRATPTGWRVQARELDIRARRWSSVVEMEVGETDLLPRVVVAALHQCFQPIVRIDYAKEKTIMARLRAGGLAVRTEEPAVVPEQTLLRPWVRHNDRYGEPRPPLGVQSIPYTYLVVQKRDGSRLECEPHTGVRFPITGKNNSRTQRFALVVRPVQPTTLIRLRTNEKPPQPLSGYDIYAKDPRNDKIELIGRTDWRGTMVLPPSEDFPLRVVYVKNGGSLLARLPTVPGVEAEMVVDLTPDDKRLQAEGFVAGVQGVLTDLVAQRELYTKRIRSRLSEGKMAEAEKLLEEFKALPTRDDVQKLIDQQQPRITSPHKKVQAKIDKQFEDTRKLLYKFVDPGLAGKLDEDVKQTKEGKGPYAAALGAIDPAASPAPAPPPTPTPAPAPPAPAAPMPMPM
jgi:hypothetical protein